MSQLQVIVSKLNKRSSVPFSFSDKNIVGVVRKGFQFEGTEVQNINNPLLGKWFIDRDGHFYWAGGLMIVDVPVHIATNIKNLPVNLPLNFRVGIDISHHNEIHDWTAFKNAGVALTYIKISEGVGTPDPMAKDRAIAARQNGFKIGYYHFCRPDTRNGGSVINDASAEANEALNIIADVTEPNLPLVLDLEDQEHWDTPLQPDDYLLWVNTFINKIKERSGLECMIYSRKEYLDRKLPSNHNLGKHRLWISRYSQKDTTKIKCPVGWDDWAMWQYCEDGIIGTNLKLDINILKDQTLF